MTVQFNASKADKTLIRKIAGRALGLGLGSTVADTPMQGWMMDVEAAHRNGCPLRLADLLAAQDFDFMHDLTGIYRHLNRRTGKLGGFFWPRFAQPAPKRGDGRAKAKRAAGAA